MVRSIFSAAIASLAGVLKPPSAASPKSTPGPPAVLGQIDAATYSRVVAIPDTHGDYEGALASVWAAFLHIEPQRAVTFNEFSRRFDEAIAVDDDFGGDEGVLSRVAGVALVQLGDMVDLGPDSENCVRLFRVIPRVLGWRVWTLYGDHEISSMRSRSAANAPRVVLNDAPMGVVRWGSSTLFVHGGVVMSWIHELLKQDNGKSHSVDIGVLNARVRAMIQSSNIDSSLMSSATSIFSDRSVASASSSHLCGTLLPAIKKTFGVQRVIVGHTPQANLRVNTRCDGQLVLADARISRWTRESIELNPVAVVLEAARGSSGKMTVKAVYGSNSPAMGNSRVELLVSSRFAVGGAGGVTQGIALHSPSTPSGITDIHQYYLNSGFATGATLVTGGPDVKVEDLQALSAAMNAPTVHIESGHLLVDAQCVSLVSMEMVHISGAKVWDFTDYKNDILRRVNLYVKNVHSQGFKLGLSADTNVLDMFCLGQRDEVFLADWRGIAALSEKERKSEMRRTRHALKAQHAALDKALVSIKQSLTKPTRIEKISHT